MLDIIDCVYGFKVRPFGISTGQNLLNIVAKTEFQDIFLTTMVQPIFEQMKKFKLYLEVMLQRNIMLQMELGGTLQLEDHLITTAILKVCFL